MPSPASLRVLLVATALASIALNGCGRSRTPAPPGGNTDPTGGVRTPENTDEACADGKDNDLDTYIDCQDTDCQQGVLVSVCRAGSESGDALCHDGQDNDNDGLGDCADPDCEFSGCFENTDEACSDGVDNDADGYMDCEDFDCKYGCRVYSACGDTYEKTELECGDGLDNDGDNHADCEDFGCRDCVAACQGGMGENTPSLCADSLDNDEDGGIDCRDTECYRLEGVEGCDTGEENTEAACSDDIDNDNDPFIDCLDYDCQGLGDCREDTQQLCEDGVDNDGDNYADCQDWDCQDFPGCVGLESTDESCSDTQDNDNDGYVDCEDFDCKFGCTVTVCPGTEKTDAACSDNVDNDGDNRLDCADRSCQDCAAACQVGTGENTLALCDNGNDDDTDNATDCRDTECVPYLTQIAGCDTGETLCGDGIDNDNDPFVDCADRDCRGVDPCVEENDTTCADLEDNDGDGFFDCDDYDCSRNVAVTVCGTIAAENTDAACGDGNDNDNDGRIDCDDNDCKLNAALEVCPVPLATTIKVLQDPADPAHPVLATPTAKVRVKLTGVTVTSPVVSNRAGKKSFFVQEAFPPADTRFRGIEVFAGDATPTVSPGDVITLVGFYTEYFGQAQILFGKADETASGSTPVPTDLETQDLLANSEAYEGVLVRLGQVKVRLINVASRGGSQPLNNDFSVLEASASNTLPPHIVSTEYVPRTPALDDRFGFLVGPVIYTWNQFRIAPRVDADIGPASGGTDDDDGDGLPNAVEASLGTNPTLPDTDGDGAGDLTEVVDVSAPADSDCDDVIDALESSTIDSDGDATMDQDDPDDQDGPTADPDGDEQLNDVDPDDDGDGLCDPGIAAPVPDVCAQLNDNCRHIANAAQANLDDDALGDACDPDIDGDGLCNAGWCVPVGGQCADLDDNCSEDANADQLDTDDDTFGDACDPDDDADAICDVALVTPGVCTLFLGDADNCRILANSDQANNDEDNFGDLCDADDDNDGVCDPGVQEDTDGCIYVDNHADNCALVVNPGQEDADGDGEGDACESVVSLPEPFDFVFNEVLADPFLNGAPMPRGDANGDGVVQATADEFIELVNVADGPVDLADCVIEDRFAVRHRFEGAPDPTVYVIPSGTAVVIFGGGNPVGVFGGARVFTSSTGTLGLNNGNSEADAEDLTLLCGDDVVIAEMGYGAEGNQNQSLTLTVQGDDTSAYDLHSTIEADVFYSPGVCADGQLFPGCL